MHDAGEHTAAVQVHLTHGQRHGERGAIPALPAHVTPDADDVRLTRLAVARQVAIVLLPIGRGHEHPDVLPNHGGGGIPKEALRRRIQRGDHAVLIDRDDPVHGGLEDGVTAGFTVPQRGLGLFTAVCPDWPPGPAIVRLAQGVGDGCRQ